MQRGVAMLRGARCACKGIFLVLGEGVPRGLWCLGSPVVCVRARVCAQARATASLAKVISITLHASLPRTSRGGAA
eukprot:3453036-Alexandrium_andersonii.AAC.1